MSSLCLVLGDIRHLAPAVTKEGDVRTVLRTLRHHTNPLKTLRKEHCRAAAGSGQDKGTSMCKAGEDSDVIHKNVSFTVINF